MLSGILLRNLNAETSEQRVLSALGMVTSFPIKSLKIPRENGTSKGICMVELYTVGEATQLNGVLTSLPNGFTVDGHNIDVCFARRIPNVTSSSSTPNPNANSAASVALAAAQWSNQTESNAMQFVAVSHPKPSPAPLLPASISTQILIPLNAPVLAADYGSVTVTGISYRKYPIPDVSTYQYEATSGYYYDPVTCLYYDANTHYYYNGTTLKYLFWSHEHQTYLPIEIISLAQNGNAVTNGPTTATASEPAKEDDTKEKADKVKIAKKIAKDMEKWAKTLNQKKETLKTSVQASLSEEPTIQLSGFNPISFGESIALKDTRLKALEKSALFDPLDDQEDEDQLPDKLSLKRTASPPSPCSVEPQQLSQVLNLTDWNKLLCLLCKRQFNSREQLMKHQQASELHKTNLFKLTGVDFTPEQIAELSQNDGEVRINHNSKFKT